MVQDIFVILNPAKQIKARIYHLATFVPLVNFAIDLIKLFNQFDQFNLTDLKRLVELMCYYLTGFVKD